MEITRQPAGETLVLQLKGRLDGAWSEHTGLALTQAIEEGWHQLQLDLSEVRFVSSAGIRVLVIHYKQLNRINGRLAVVRPSPEVRQVLQMSGLGMMIQEERKPEAAVSAPAQPSPEGPRRMEREGLHCEIFSLTAGSTLCVRAIGAEGAKTGEPVRFPENALGLGLGAFGGDGEQCQGRLGEFLALGGAAITQPADGKQTTDYVVEQGELVPELMTFSGLVAQGAFAQLVRFDAREMPGGAAPLSALLALALELCGNRACGFALAAETAALVGAALTSQPDAQGRVPFDFPEIRNRLVFTAEPAWPHSLCLAAGFAAPSGETPLAPLLRPVLPEAALRAHVHAAAFPYRPLPKGPLELGPTVRSLLEEERALGLLHLVHDWRQPGGAGESRFHRGAFWLAPLQ